MENECVHPFGRHLADNGPTSAGAIYWCPNCGALAVTAGGHVSLNERKWQPPDVAYGESEGSEMNRLGWVFMYGLAIVFIVAIISLVVFGRYW